MKVDASDRRRPTQYLIPAISTSISRYERSYFIQPYYQVINAGPARSCRPLTLNWRRLVHPEGQPYFVLTGEFHFTVVTAANIEDVHTEKRILGYAKLASSEAELSGVTIPPECELVLSPRAPHECDYYFVDHVANTLFWLTDVRSELLNIPPARSLSNLEPILQAYYWAHIEYFPIHHESRQDQHSQFIDDLYNIISHGQVDKLTTRTSTFPFTADKCEQFLKLLSSKKGQYIDGYTLCYAARIARVITANRFCTCYGQEFAQLDSKQYTPESSERQWLWTAANLLMRYIPQYYNILLEDLYANDSASDQWIQFLSLCIADWTDSLSWSLPVVIASILLAMAGGTFSTAIPSVLSSALSIISASCLRRWHRSFAEVDPSDGLTFIRYSKSETVGFLHLSFLFSLPQASYFWGVLFLVFQFLFVAYNKGSKLVVVIAGIVLVCVLGSVWGTIFPEDSKVTLTVLHQAFQHFDGVKKVLKCKRRIS